MSEKGGKGYSQPKSALKSPVPSKGKDDSSLKSKRGRKVQFDQEESDLLDGNLAKSNGKPDKPSKGDWGKSGKQDKPTKAGKSPSAKEKDTLELRVEGLSEGTTCLMDCEALEILQGIQDHMAELSADAEIKIPSSFDRGLIYAKRGELYTNPYAVRQILEPLKTLGLPDGEICLIANLCLDSVEEVFALVPSLKKFKKPRLLEEALKKVLDELAKLKASV